MPGNVQAVAGLTLPSGSTDLVFTYTNALPGDKLVLFGCRNNLTGTWSEFGSAGLTVLGSPAQGMAAYYRTVLAGEEAGGFTLRSATNTANIAVGVGMIVRGVGLPVVGGVSYKHQLSNANIALDSVTGAAAGLLVGLAVAPVTQAATYTVPGSMTQKFAGQFGAQQCTGAVGQEVLAAGGATGTRTFNRNPSSNQKGLLVAFEPLATGPFRWNGSTETALQVTEWDGAAEVPATMEVYV